MDPNATLAELRRLIGEYRYRSDMLLRINDEHTDPIVERIGALDDWLTKGGCLPDPWNINRKATER